MNATLLRYGWRLMPDRATVSYQAQTSLGVYDPAVSVANAWWRPGVTVEGAPSDGVYIRSLRTWLFPKQFYDGVPAIGDVITNPVTAIDPVAVAWTVTGLSDVGAIGAWSLDSISLTISADLKDLVTFSRPGNTQDAAYRQALTPASYTPYAVNIACRLQPEDGSAAVVMDRVTIAPRYTLYLSQRVAVRAKDLAAVGGQTYTVIASVMPDRISDVQTVTLEQVR